MTAKTMKAFQFTNPQRGLELTTVPIPEPRKGQVLVQIKAAGLCHTDVNIITGRDDTFFWQRPITLGHEVSGTIVELGEGVTEFAKGDRVVSLIGTQHPITFSDALSAAGLGYDGGFAEFAIFNVFKTLKIPEGVSYADAALGTDAYATAYHAVQEAKLTKDSKIAIIGLGGLGQAAVQFSAKSGAKVYGVDLDSAKFVVAQKNGAYACANSIEYFKGQYFDVVIDFAGAGVTTAGAIKVVKQGATILLVGLASKNLSFDSHEFIAMGVTLRGITGSSPQEVKDVLDHFAAGTIEPESEEIPFDQIKEGLERLDTGKNVLYRLWADPSK